jgi:hypothetical protein
VTNGFLTIIHWPSGETANPQRHSYSHFARFLALHAEWIIFLDLDELINLKLHDTIAAFLDDYGDVSGVAINWRFFGDGGELKYRPGFLMDRFTTASTSDFGPNQQVKTFVRSADLVLPDIHNPKIKEGTRTVSPNREEIDPFPSVKSKKVNLEIAQINHYFGKTREEWQIKRMRGKADYSKSSPDRLRPDGEFEVYNRNEETDLTIQRFRPRLLEALEKAGIAIEPN